MTHQNNTLIASNELLLNALAASSQLNSASNNFQMFGNMMNLNGYLSGYDQQPGGNNSSSSSNLLNLNLGNESTAEISSPDSSNNSKHRQMSSGGAHQELDDDEESNKHVTKLFVGNLPTSTTLQELLAVFKRFGPVNEKLSVVKDQNYAFIHFYNRKDAQVALQEVNDSLFKDRYIRVQFSTSQGYTFNKFKGKYQQKNKCFFF